MTGMIFVGSRVGVLRRRARPGASQVVLWRAELQQAGSGVEK
jgi:hypothetical protein